MGDFTSRNRYYSSIIKHYHYISKAYIVLCFCSSLWWRIVFACLLLYTAYEMERDECSSPLKREDWIWDEEADLVLTETGNVLILYFSIWNLRCNRETLKVMAQKLECGTFF